MSRRVFIALCGGRAKTSPRRQKRVGANLFLVVAAPAEGTMKTEFDTAWIHAVRGGSWWLSSRDVHVTYRNVLDVAQSNHVVVLRVVRRLP